MDLTKIPMGEAMAVALAKSGLTIDAVADEMGWSPGQGYRFFNVNDSYWPALHSIPRLCAVLGNTIILDWLTKNTAEMCAVKGRPLSVPSVLRQVSELLRGVGETSSVVGQIVDDGRITPAEARDLNRRLTKIAACLCDFIAAAERASKIR